MFRSGACGASDDEFAVFCIGSPMEISDIIAAFVALKFDVFVVAILW